MGRLLIAGLLATSVLAAPIPKDETGRIARVYGVAHDPDKGAEFRNVGDTLHVSLPLRPRLLAPFRGALNAPRVWREVRGNFTATVKVSFPVRAKVPPRHEDVPEARAGGGLVVWLDATNLLTLTRDERECDGTPGEYLRAECCAKGFTRGAADYRAPQKAGYLRVTRWDKGLSCSYSRDGKKWTPLGSYAAEWGDTLKVGVVAENSFKAPFEVAFDEYTLIPTKE